MPGHYCLDCNYTLQGLTQGTCPECGRPFDTGNSKTYLTLPKSRLAKWFGARKIAGPDELLAHIPSDRRKAIIKTASQCRPVHTVIFLFLAYIVALILLLGLGVSAFKNPANRKLLYIASHVFMLATPLGFMFLSMLHRRAFGYELHQMNIRPASCPKCAYNLAGIDAPQCPKCQTPLAPPPPDDASPV